MSSFFRYACLLILSCSLTAGVFAQQADLSVSKTGLESAPVGADVPYTVIVTNNGPNDAFSVALTDAIPAGMTFVSATQNSGPPFNCSNGPADTITCTGAQLNNLESAAFTFVLNMTTAPPPGGVFTNVATVTAATPDPNVANNTDDAATGVGQADLGVTKSGPETAPAGSQVEYTVVVTNNGPGEALSVVVKDEIPIGMTYFSSTAAPGFTCSDSASEVVCEAASLAAGATGTFTFVFTINAEAMPGTAFTNTVTVASTAYDPNEENNTAVVVTTTPFPPSADLAVTKAGPTAAGPGTDVVYTITLSNNGPASATVVTLQDVLPGNMTFVSLVHDGGPALSCTTPAMGAGGTVTCNAATLGVGVVTLTLTTRVPAGTPSGTEYSNSVVVSSSSNDPNEENNAATLGTTVSQVDVSVVKTGPAAINAGTNVAYTITVANTGPDVALSVTLTDQLPVGTTLVSFSQTSGPAGSCTVPSAGSHGTVVCTFEFLSSEVPAVFALQVDADDTTSITNTAAVSTGSFDTDNTDNTSSVTTTVTPQADVVVTKTGPATVTAGTNLTYNVTITNNGPSTATNVSLTDNVPANTTFVSATQTSGPVFACGTAAGTITCTIPALAPGASAIFAFTVNVSPAATGTVDNTANVTATTADPAGGNNTSAISSAIVSSADLAVVKSGPSIATPGANVTYTVIATNGGPSTAANVTLTDIGPANTTFVSATQTGGPTFSCATVVATTTCTIAAFPPATPATFTFVFAISPAATGTIENTATLASATTPDPSSSNNTSATTATLGASADLSVTKSGPAAVTAGSNATYTITVANGGPSVAANVTLTDTLPSNASFVSMTQTSGPVFNCAPPAGGQFVCTIASLAPAASATFAVVVTVNPDASGPVANTAAVSTTTSDPNAANNTATTTATLGMTADLSITKSGPAAVTAGSNATYTITVANSGPSAAANVTLTDTLSPNATFVSMTQTSGPVFNCAPPSGGQVVCSIGSLAPAASATFTAVVTANPDASGIVENTATVSSVTSDPNATDNTATSTAAIDPGPTDLSITKTANGGAFGPGSSVTYTIVVTNNGPGVAFGTTVTDVLPPGTAFVSATPTQGSCSGTTTVICTLGTLAPATTATITLVVTLPATQGEITNTASVFAANVDAAATNNVATASLAVVSTIPSLSEYALMLLAMILAVTGFVAARR